MRSARQIPAAPSHIRGGQNHHDRDEIEDACHGDAPEARAGHREKERGQKLKSAAHTIGLRPHSPSLIRTAHKAWGNDLHETRNSKLSHQGKCCRKAKRIYVHRCLSIYRNSGELEDSRVKLSALFKQVAGPGRSGETTRSGMRAAGEESRSNLFDACKIARHVNEPRWYQSAPWVSELPR